MKIASVFEEVLESPGMFIGNKSVTRLQAFIDGYWLATHRMNLAAKDDFSLAFNEWISRRFLIQTAHNWASIILFMNSGDENAAFDMTKELWEKYKSESS